MRRVSHGRVADRTALSCSAVGAQADEKLASEQAAALEKGIDGAWRKRIEQGDPFEKLLQKDKVATCKSVPLSEMHMREQCGSRAAGRPCHCPRCQALCVRLHGQSA